MGARLARMFRNFNVESRALREISRDKPRAAPRHAAEAPRATASAEAAESVRKKDESLLEKLRAVYVESTEPPAAETQEVAAAGGAADRRPLRFGLPGGSLGLPQVSDVPRGKLTLAEALKALGGHQHQPRTWTPEKIAQEYSLDLSDTRSLVEFFIPFKVEILPPKTRTAKQIKAS